VSGDDAGSGGSVSAGASLDRVILTLGAGPVLTVRGIFNAAATNAGSPSGIDVSSNMMLDAIEHAISGGDAVPSQAVDLLPAFHGPTQILASASRPTGALGDLDGDGDLDLVTAGRDGNGNTPTEIWFNDGNGTFSNTQGISGLNVRDVALGDLDGDGDLDLVLGVEGANRVYLNDGTGSFADAGVALGGSVATFAVVLGDLDGDGDLDVIFGNYGDSRPLDEVYRNDSSNGALTLTLWQSFGRWRWRWATWTPTAIWIWWK